MATILKFMFPCLPLGNTKHSTQSSAGSTKYQPLSEKSVDHLLCSTNGEATISTDEAASSIVAAMATADKPGASLNAHIQSIVHQAGGWSEFLAIKILTALEEVIKNGKFKNGALQEAYDKAYEAAKEFATEHPIATAVLCTIIAVGILWVLAPYALEILGFAELGPVEGESTFSVVTRMNIFQLRLRIGTWAAAWQARYLGFVPKGSWFSFFQRLGMLWKHL